MPKEKKNIQDLIAGIGPSADLTPAEIAKKLAMKTETCKGVLNRSPEAYPPVRVNEDNGHRFYGRETLMKLIIRDALRRKPAAMEDKEINRLFCRTGVVSKLWKACLESPLTCKHLALDLASSDSA